MIELWSLNRVLRWTGFRAMVQVASPGEEAPTKVGVKWVGLYGSKGWMKWEPWARPFWQTGTTAPA